MLSPGTCECYIYILVKLHDTLAILKPAYPLPQGHPFSVQKPVVTLQCPPPYKKLTSLLCPPRVHDPDSAAPSAFASPTLGFSNPVPGVCLCCALCLELLPLTLLVSLHLLVTSPGDKLLHLN